jgi:hypothetical protein
VPQNYSILPIQSSRPTNATYEAFGPSSFYQLSEINIFAPQSGRYYLAILGNGSGSYGIALGYLEEFTLGERIITWSAPSMHKYLPLTDRNDHPP